MRILVADDHPSIRQSLKAMLLDAFPGCVVIEAFDGCSVSKPLESEPFDLLLLDIEMPGRSGLEVLHDVKKLHLEVRVIIVTARPEDQYAARCLRAGACAFVNKNRAPEELATAIASVMNGGRYISSGFED